jgi:hypothetical protein
MMLVPSLGLCDTSQQLSDNLVLSAGVTWGLMLLRLARMVLSSCGNATQKQTVTHHIPLTDQPAAAHVGW